MDRKILRQKIEAALAQTEDAVRGYEEMSAPVSPDDAIGRVSRMDAINNKSVTEATLRQARTRLSKLQFALTQVDDELFGFCSNCKQPIPEQRLLLLPESRHCVRCAH